MWMITKDHVAMPERDDTGLTSSDYKPFHQGKEHQFKMFDDDGILYYEGVSSEEDFLPLDDFGMPHAGCTYIEYRQEDGTWQQL